MLKMEQKTKNILYIIWKIFMMVLGTTILAFSTSIFMVPFGIITGGLAGIGILFEGLIAPDILIIILEWVIFFIGLILLGFKFSLTTLVATIIYGPIVSLLLRTGVAQYFCSILVGQEITLTNGVIENLSSLNVEIGIFVLCGIFSGLLTGLGCALTFVGGGSSGGLDIISFVLNKFFGIKESTSILVMDAAVVAAGLIISLVTKNNERVILGLVGIVSAVIASFVIDVVYNSNQGAVNADIISDKYEEIIEFSIKELDRSATIFNAKGAYTNEDRKVVRITFKKREYIKVKDAIAQIDPNAFVTFSKTNFVGGEGFSRMQKSSDNLIKTLQNSTKKDENEK